MPVVIVAIVGLLLPSVTQAATLSELLKQQSQLTQQQLLKEQQLKQKQNQAQNLSNAIDDLNDNIDYTQSRISYAEGQIRLTNEVIAQLDGDIKDGQSQLDKLQKKLRNSLITLYEVSRTSPTEQIVQGESVSDIVSRTMYMQAIQDQLQADINKTNTLLADLNDKKGQSEKQKQSLDGLKSELASAQQQYGRQKSQKQNYLAATQQDQAKLQSDIQKIQKQQESLSDAIYEARRKMAGSGESSVGGTGGYPYTGSCGGADPWLFIKCQCTSFAAWKFQRLTGEVFYNTRPGEGSAWNWPNLARDQGYAVSSTPHVGDIVSWQRQYPNMPYGHVAIVTGVHGSLIDVDEYNWTVREAFDHRSNVDPNRYGSHSFIH